MSYTWNDVIETARHFDTNGEAQDAVNQEDDVPNDEIVVVERDDAYHLIVGTPEGNAVIRADRAYYPDDNNPEHYKGDEHRDRVLCDLLPERVYARLHNPRLRNRV